MKGQGQEWWASEVMQKRYERQPVLLRMDGCLFAPVKALYLTVFRVLILGEEMFSFGEEEQMNLTAA